MSLLLAEGATDEVFYLLVKGSFLADCRCTVRELGGLFNVNRKIINEILRCCNNHTDDLFRVYCCLDRESRDGTTPGFDVGTIVKYVRDNDLRQVLSVDVILATQQIESWFLYDIEAIYKHLKVPRAKRNPRRYQPPEKFTYKDLQKLFERYGKAYNKGRRAANFISNLDLNRIAKQCAELRDGIALIKSQAEDRSNHLFPAGEADG